jgi:hypothetical protein
MYVLNNRRYTQMYADDIQTLLATDPHRNTRTKLNVGTFNFNSLFVWRPARQKIVIPLRGIKLVHR